MLRRECCLRLARFTGRALGVLIILMGMSLALVQTGQAAPQASGGDCQALYRVRVGDTVNQIANHYGVSVVDLLYANGMTIYGSHRLHPGDILCIPYPGGSGGRWSDAVLHARVTSNLGLEIWGRYFPHNRDFAVRLDTGEWGLSKRLGTTGSSNTGEIADTFKIPLNYRFAPSFGVCLKDPSSNRYLCVSIRNPYRGWNPWFGTHPPCGFGSIHPDMPGPLCLSKAPES
jgi:hypothetical protein